MARKKVASKSTIIDNGQPVGVRFEFENGTILKLMFEELTDQMKLQLIAHGLLQKIGDSYSQSGGDITVAQAAAEVTIEALQRGEWNVRGEGDGGMLLEALIEAMADKLDEEAVREKFRAFDSDQKAKLRKHKQIKAIMARLALERAEAAAEDAEDLEL